MNFSTFFLLSLLAVTPLYVGCSSSSASSTHGSGIKDITFDDLKFEMEPTEEFQESMLPSTVKERFDQNIRIRGYIYPTLKKNGIKKFVLVRDNLECCFGPGAALFDCIFVHMKEGKTAEYSIRPVAVEGKFSYEPFEDIDGNIMAIYRLDADSVDLH